MTALSLNAVSHAYDSVRVLDGITLDVTAGEIVAFVGPSGCGKTTLVSLIGGHLSPTRGRITRAGNARTIYQEGGLYPWLTVYENIAMGDAQHRDAEVRELVELIGLTGFEEHYPHQLSGGMRQRVELARALAGHADLLLMDEPFSALDYQTRRRMRTELLAALEARPRTVVLVTHDIEEAVELADRVFVMTVRPSRVKREVQVTTPRPRTLLTPEVASTVEEILAEMPL